MTEFAREPCATPLKGSWGVRGAGLEFHFDVFFEGFLASLEESGFGAQSMASSVCDGTSRRGGMRSAGSSSARTSSNSIRSRSRWQAGEPSGSTSRVFLPCMVRGGLKPSFALSFIKRFSWGLYCSVQKSMNFSPNRHLPPKCVLNCAFFDIFTYCSTITVNHGPSVVSQWAGTGPKYQEVQVRLDEPLARTVQG